ncbi:MAG: hypothetical protein ACI8RZ_008011, partial [Myxococcota bacterium]
MTAPKPDGIIRLHGREYKTVALRVQEFREKHPIDDGWGLISKIVEVNAEIVIFRASIIDPQGREIAVGFAEEKRTNRGINATSALENCETSALGRALAAAGFGGSEYASADELVHALNEQGRKAASGKPAAANTAPKPEPHESWSGDRARFVSELKTRQLGYKAVAAYFGKMGWGAPPTWTTENRIKFFEDLDAGK